MDGSEYYGLCSNNIPQSVNEQAPSAQVHQFERGPNNVRFMQPTDMSIHTAQIKQLTFIVDKNKNIQSVERKVYQKITRRTGNSISTTIHAEHNASFRNSQATGENRANNAVTDRLGSSSSESVRSRSREVRSRSRSPIYSNHRYSYPRDEHFHRRDSYPREEHFHRRDSYPRDEYFRRRDSYPRDEYLHRRETQTRPHDQRRADDHYNRNRDRR